MKRNIIRLMTLCTVAVLALASCKKDNKPQANVPENGFLATIEANQGNGSRTHLVGTEVQWNAGDQIVVRNGNGATATYRLTAGENTTEGTFLSSEDDNDFFQPTYTAVYPATGNTITGEGAATITLPATQAYVANSFANGAMPMMAVSGEQTLEFKNALGGICFPMTGSRTVTRLVLTSNSADDNLSGVFSADYNNGEPTLTCTTGNGNSITLDCGEGVALDATTATDFIIMVPAGSLANGFKLEAYNGEEKIFEKTNDANLGADFIPRSVIKKVNSNLEVGEAIVAPAGAIAGAYSVSATQQVWFSQGNLQYQASTSTWRFAENQWDYVGNAAGNTAPSATQAEWIDLFGWGTSGFEHGATCWQPWSTSTTISQYNPYNSTSTNLYDGEGTADWGYNAISNGGNQAGDISGRIAWRTLTKDEWGYLFSSRQTGKTVNGTSHARYTEATINTDGISVNGIILFPDGYSGPTSSTDGITFGNINSSSAWGTKCTTAGWQALEAAGCVFLPAAGYRHQTTVINVGYDGVYWSSTYYDNYNAYRLYFFSGWVGPHMSGNRNYGFSVRLACPAN